MHDPAKYNIKSIGDAIIDFIENVISSPIWLLGHLSGGLISAYIASETDLCSKLILEDPPFFASQGERRKNIFNYVDLSTICQNYNLQKQQDDFVLYYFCNKYAWNFFPEQSREKVKGKLSKLAEDFRRKNPTKDLKVPFWPKAALNEEDVQRVAELIGDCRIVRFDCGHGIHVEKPKEFVKCLVELG